MNADLEHSPPVSPRLFENRGIPVVHAAVCAGSAETLYLRAGDGPPVVLLHGAGDAVESWSPLVRMLSPRFRVIVPQEVRHREPDGAGSSLWLPDFLDGLGLQRVSLVASGEGEALALGFVREEPERVERLVLLGTIAAGTAASEALGEWVIHLLDAGDARVAVAPGPADLSGFIT